MSATAVAEIVPKSKEKQLWKMLVALRDPAAREELVRDYMPIAA